MSAKPETSLSNSSHSQSGSLPEAAVIVADAHLGHSPDSASDRAFNSFLESVPAMGNHLVINGDLFDFWFEYRAVIPRSAFSTLAALAAIQKRGVRLTFVGGNHDRWGGRFWQEEMGGEYFRESGEVTLGGHRSLVHHGDGLASEHLGGALMHRITRNPVTAWTFRLIHPDLGFWVVKKMSRVLGQKTRDGAVLNEAAQAQSRLARRMLEERPDIDLVVLGHTHRQAMEEVADGRWYVNSGGWMEDQCFAVVTSDGPELRVYDARGV